MQNLVNGVTDVTAKRTVEKIQMRYIFRQGIGRVRITTKNSTKRDNYLDIYRSRQLR